MITQRTAEQPASRTGFEIKGQVTTDEGVGTFTIKGRDYSARIVGLVLTPLVEDAAGTTYIPVINTIVYSSSTKLTTVTFTIKKLVHTAVDDNVLSVTDVDIVVHYSAWVDDEIEGLPSDALLAENDTNLQAY